MSGPKCHDLTVENNRRLEEQRLQAMRTTFAELAQDLDGQNCCANALGLSSILPGPVPPASSDLASWSDAVERLRVSIREQRRRQAAHRVREADAAVEAALAGITSPQEARFKESVRASNVPLQTSVNSARAANVARVFASLSPFASDLERSTIAAQIAMFAASTDDVAAGRLEQDIRLLVSSANERIRLLEAGQLRAQTLFAELKLLGHVEDSLVEELGKVVSGIQPLSENLKYRVHAAMKRRREEVDMAYASASIAEALEELGYVVGESFSTLLVQGAMAVAAKPPGDYGVRFTLRDGSVRSHVVRSSQVARSREEDVEQEEFWCGSLRELSARLGNRGVRLRNTFALLPGSAEVPEVDGSQLSVQRQARVTAEGRRGMK
jgi:hypothetical protein